MTDIVRDTRETSVRVALGPGTGEIEVKTTVPFLDHMVRTFARYANLQGSIEASGDLRHHIIEDVAIVCGMAIAELSAPNRRRYGDRTIPMDDALVQVSLDNGGRSYYEGPLPSRMYDHWMRSFAENAKATVHVRVLRGTDRHHIVEAAFKALGYAIRDSLAPDGSVVNSTKGEPRVRTRNAD
jgi:imidazoleglycerol-phosphate dehydratase